MNKLIVCIAVLSMSVNSTSIAQAQQSSLHTSPHYATLHHRKDADFKYLVTANKIEVFTLKNDRLKITSSVRQKLNIHKQLPLSIIAQTPDVYVTSCYLTLYNKLDKLAEAIRIVELRDLDKSVQDFVEIKQKQPCYTIWSNWSRQGEMNNDPE